MFLDQWKKETGVNILGFDINKDAIATAKVKGLSAEYARAESLPLGNNSVDLLTSLHTYEHVENLPKSFQEIQRVLKPGAKAVIITPPNLFGLETIKVAIENLPENTKKKGPLGLFKTILNGYKHARLLHRSILGGPFGGARKHAEKILKQNGINLKVRGGMRPNLTFANLLIFEKPTS
jgi:ubiquinone/menaquinone biosynthesis C-methylase UbiE